MVGQRRTRWAQRRWRGRASSSVRHPGARSRPVRPRHLRAQPRGRRPPSPRRKSRPTGRCSTATASPATTGARWPGTSPSTRPISIRWVPTPSCGRRSFRSCTRGRCRRPGARGRRRPSTTRSARGSSGRSTGGRPTIPTRDARRFTVSTDWSTPTRCATSCTSRSTRRPCCRPTTWRSASTTTRPSSPSRRGCSRGTCPRRARSAVSPSGTPRSRPTSRAIRCLRCWCRAGG